MNERGTEVLSQYDLEIIKTCRTRGAVLCETSAGLKLLKEYHGNLRRLLFEEELLLFIKDSGYPYVDGIVRTKEDSLTAQDESLLPWILKDWFFGRECDNHSLLDLKKSVGVLGRIHLILAKTELKELDPARGAESMDLLGICRKRNRELKRTRNYIRGVTRKNIFELRVLEYFDEFYSLALSAEKSLENSGCAQMYEKAKANGSICHGNFNYHNVLIDRDQAAVTNFGGAIVGIQVVDFYDFIRKTMEKNNWDTELGKYLFDTYARIRGISREELNLLSRLLFYPEKFFKIMNFYMNSKKTRMSEKNLEKLEMVLRQQEKKMKFIQGIL